MTRTREQAREAYAAQMDRKGSAWANSAASVRAGFENCWIAFGLDALEASIHHLADDDEEGSGPKAPNDP